MERPGPLAGLLRLFGSYGLAVVVLLLLLLLTFFGTIQQGELGLYETQRLYFDSWFTRVDTGLGVGQWHLILPLPGGQLLMWILAANLIVGGMVRMRRSWRTAGILVAHVVIAMMLLAGFVKYYQSDDGHVTLWPRESSAEFESHHRWELVIETDAGDGELREWKVRHPDLADLEPGGERTFTHPELPFDVRLSHWMPNAIPRRKGPMFEVSVPVVDGIYLDAAKLEPQNERNLAGAYVTLEAKDGGPSPTGIVFGFTGSPSTTARAPWVTRVDGDLWSVELRRERYPLPFMLRLDEFRAEFHPGTSMASNYQSEVTKTEDGVGTPVTIRMNEPLRQGDYVVFQSNYGPPNARPGERMYSGFSVVRNPSDQWPLYSLLVIAAGLLFHFGVKLVRYTQSERRKMA